MFDKRFRSLAALLALFAFSAYVGETLYASMCPPEMDMGTDVEQTAPSGEDSEECPMETTASSDTSPDDSEDRDTETPPCPLVAAGASGCVVVSLPAASSAGLQPSPEGVLRALARDQVRDLLIVAPIFHPPIA